MKCSLYASQQNGHTTLEESIIDGRHGNRELRVYRRDIGRLASHGLGASVEADGVTSQGITRIADKLCILVTSRRTAMLESVPKGLSSWGARDSKGLFRPSWSERCGPSHSPAA